MQDKTENETEEPSQIPLLIEDLSKNTKDLIPDAIKSNKGNATGLQSLVPKIKSIRQEILIRRKNKQESKNNKRK